MTSHAQDRMIEGVSGEALSPAPKTNFSAKAAAIDLARVQRQITQLPVSFIDTGFALADVQTQLEASLGVNLTLVDGASAIRYRGKISGDNGIAFIESLAAKLNLEWAFGRNSIYLSPVGFDQTAIFDIPSAEAGYRAVDLSRQKFEGLGSNIRVLLRQDKLTVTGIPAWVDNVAEPLIPGLLQQAMSDNPEPETVPSDSSFSFGDTSFSPYEVEEALTVMVFRLNNAYVDDKQISVGSNSVIFPGVKTLFSRFTGISSTGRTAPTSPTNSKTKNRVPRLDALSGERRRLWPEDEPTATELSDSGVDTSPVRDGPAIIADPRTNSLIVRDKATMLGPYTELIRILDQPVEMVQLDAFIIDIKASRFNEFGFGLSWNNASVNSPSFSPGGFVPGGANLILQASQGAQLLSQIRALESEGESELLTVPSVVTQNNLEASFSARENFFVKVSGNLDASLTEVTAETLLSVTPLVEQRGELEGETSVQAKLNRRIRLLINIQDGQVDASNSAVVDSLPRTLENQITTQTVVRDGETLVIGGQMVRKEISSESGIPIVRHLPILGALTNSRTTRFEEYVRVYLVRPRILSNDTPVLAIAGDSSIPVDLQAARDEPQTSATESPARTVLTTTSVQQAQLHAAASALTPEPEHIHTLSTATAPAMTPENAQAEAIALITESFDLDGTSAKVVSRLPQSRDSMRDPSTVETESYRVEQDVDQSQVEPDVDQGHVEPDVDQSHVELDVDQGHVEPDVDQGHVEPDVDQGHVEPDVDQGHVEPDVDQSHVEPDVDTNQIEIEMGFELAAHTLIEEPLTAATVAESSDPRITVDPHIVPNKTPARWLQEYTVQSQDTLWSIASKLAPQGIKIQRMMIELKRINPEAFIDGNINQIREGALIITPDFSTLPDGAPKTKD
jgi:FimV-like protein